MGSPLTSSGAIHPHATRWNPMRRMPWEGDPGYRGHVVCPLPDRNPQVLPGARSKHLSPLQIRLSATRFALRVFGRLPGMRSGESRVGSAVCAMQGENPVGYASGLRTVLRRSAAVGDQPEISRLRRARGSGGLRRGICHDSCQRASQDFHRPLAGGIRHSRHRWPIHLGEGQEAAPLQVTPGKQE